MALRFRLSPVDCVTVAGSDHMVASQDAAGIVLQRVDMPDTRVSITHEELLKLLAGPNVQLRRGYFASAAAARRLRADTSYLGTLPARIRDELLWKAAWCRAFLQAEGQGEVTRTETVIKAVLPVLKERVNTLEHAAHLGRKRPRAGTLRPSRDAPCARTLLSWVRLYEALAESPLALVRQRRGAATFHRKFAAEAECLLAECTSAYLDRNQPTQDQIIAAACKRFKEANITRHALGQPALPIPSGRTIRRRLALLDRFEVVAQRQGLEAARRKFGFHETGLCIEHPMQRIEMDDWEIDVATLLVESGALEGLGPAERARFEVGRRWLCVAVDCATRCIIAFRITEKPTTQNALETLQLITLDKTPIAEAAGCQSTWHQHGGIETLVTDQGPTFASIVFRTAVADLGSVFEAPPAGVPKLRSRIERVFRSFGQQLAPMLIGRTFGNPAERGDYPSEDWAALTDDDLARIFTRFIVDIYHNTPHAGLNGETPANTWTRLVAEQGATPPPDANHRRAVFGIEVTRKLDRHGVRVCGVNYTCPEMQALLLHGHVREITLRLDPMDLTYVSVLIAHAWHPAQAVSRSVWGLSLEEWERIIRGLRTRFREEAKLTEEVVSAAREGILGIDADARQRARALRRVMPFRTTADHLDRTERNLFLGLEIGPAASAAYGPETGEAADLLSDVILPVPRGTPSPGTRPAPVCPSADDPKPPAVPLVEPPASGLLPPELLPQRSPWRFWRD